MTPEAYAVPNEQWPRSTSKRQSSAEWFARAAYRKQQIDRYLWNEGQKLYYDYDTVKKRMSRYESATSFWPLWAGCASEDQALKLVYVSARSPPLAAFSKLTLSPFCSATQSSLAWQV